MKKLIVATTAAAVLSVTAAYADQTSNPSAAPNNTLQVNQANCGAGSTGCNPCAAVMPCSPCNPCAASNPCAAGNCNPCATSN